MNWENLKLFYIVARERNISKAAIKLNLTTSTLSKKINYFEKSLKTTLFKRHLKGVDLTSHGKVLLSEVEKIYSQVNYLDCIFNNNSQELNGTLKIASDFGFVDTWLNKRVTKFMKNNPAVLLTIKAQSEQADLITDDIDLCFTTSTVKSNLIDKTLIKTWQRKLYAHKSYLDVFGMPEKISDLDKHKLIAFGENKTFPDENMDWHLSIGCKGEHRQPYLTVNTMRSLILAAQEGLGIISFSEQSELLGENDLINILPTMYGPRIDLYMANLKSMNDWPLMKNFKEFIKNEIR